MCQGLREISTTQKSRRSAIRSLIERHQRIISLSDNIDNFFSFVALLQFVWNTIVICSIGIVIMIVSKSALSAGKTAMFLEDERICPGTTRCAISLLNYIWYRCFIRSFWNCLKRQENSKIYNIWFVQSKSRERSRMKYSNSNNTISLRIMRYPISLTLGLRSQSVA